MSIKYISQRDSDNFIYPNNKLSEYDIDIVHDINDNSVSGTVTTFSATTFNSSSLTISYNITWNKNNADPYINSGGLLNLFSIHMLAEGQDYFKPFRMVHYVSTGNTTATTVNSVGTFTVTPSLMGLSGFTSGDYSFEVRFIGKRAVSLTCVEMSLTPTTPTPTPTTTLTPTPTVTSTSGLTPTPTPTLTLTPTPSSTSGLTPTPTPTPTSTSGGTSGELYVYAKYINSSDELGYELNGGPYLGIGTVPTTSCDFLAVITGLTNGDSIVFTTLLNKAISGDPSDCPVSAGSCSYTHTFTGTGSNFVYITIDGMNNC